jgi:flagellar hook-associated protein 2
LFQNSQTVASTNSAIVSATTTNSVGAVVGGYQVAVSQMATSAQQTFAFASPTAASTLEIDHAVANTDNTTTSASSTYNIPAGASAQDVVNQINADAKGVVWGTVVNGSIVLSDRSTGSNSSFSLAAGSTGGLTAQGTQTAGQDAQFTINNQSQTSHSNTVSGAIPGVSLTLGGITGSGSPVTVNVGAPAVSTSGITQAVQNFLSTYNSVIQTVSGQLSTAPSTSDPTVGTLYMDPGLQDLLTNMRQAMYQGGSGLPPGMASMLDLGVSTGSTTGSGTVNQNAVSGQLTLDTTALTNAITSNPAGVTAVLKSWATSFAKTVNTVADVGGTIDSRMTGNQAEITALNHRIASMQSALTDQQNQLTQMFAHLESALSQNQSTSSWLTSQISSLTKSG